MKVIRGFLMFFVVAATLYPAYRVRVGVIDFAGKNGVGDGDAQTITDMFRIELVNSPHFQVLERTKMDTILEEQEFQQTGCTESECAVEIGRMLNMELMVYGSVSKLGDFYYLMVSAVAIETTEVVIGVKKRLPDFNEIDAAMDELVTTLESIVSEETADATAATVAEERGGTNAPAGRSRMAFTDITGGLSIGFYSLDLQEHVSTYLGDEFAIAAGIFGYGYFFDNLLIGGEFSVYWNADKVNVKGFRSAYGGLLTGWRFAFNAFEFIPYTSVGYMYSTLFEMDAGDTISKGGNWYVKGGFFVNLVLQERFLVGLTPYYTYVFPVNEFDAFPMLSAFGLGVQFSYFFPEGLYEG